MDTPISPIEMRRVMLDGFQQHITREISDDELQEYVRVDERGAVAYCYRTHNLFAMWMVQVGLVQFYDDQGNMLQTLDLTVPATKRRAA